MAIITCTITVEMWLDAFLVDESGNYLVDENDNFLVADGWYDITNDVLIQSNPTWTHGNSGRTIFDRVANIGTFTFALNNSEWNQAQLAGYYSPDHGNRATRFGLDTKVRITIVEGVTTHEEWQGTINTISPIAGQYKERQTLITAEDWMAHAYRDKIRGITVQTNKRDDEILTTLLSIASEAPDATNFSVGDDTYTYALHDENSITSTLARVFQKLSMSGLGRIYLDGYNTLVYKSRSDLLLAGATDATFSDDMTDLKVSRSKSQRVKEILVTAYPSQIDTTPAVLWVAQREISLTSGQEITFDISFRDPEGRATRVAALSLETLTADTDYKFSSVSGSGNDLNGSLTATITLKADIATVYLKNNSGGTGYLWFHQQRGTGVYLYEPVTIVSQTDQPNGETLNIDLIYQDDQFVAQDISSLVTFWYTSDNSDVESMTFIANKSQDLMDAAFLPCGSLVTIYETQTGIASSFIVNGTSKTLLAGKYIQVTWYLTYANQISGVCKLDVVGLAELDSTAVLGA